MEKDSAKKPAIPIGAQLRRAASAFARHSSGVMNHFYFIFVMVMFLAIGGCVYFITLAFSISDDGYRLQKTQELSKSFRIVQDKDVVDRVLTLQTANAGPILPNYDPERDNPFFE